MSERSDSHSARILKAELRSLHNVEDIFALSFSLHLSLPRDTCQNVFINQSCINWIFWTTCY